MCHELVFPSWGLLHRSENFLLLSLRTSCFNTYLCNKRQSVSSPSPYPKTFANLFGLFPFQHPHKGINTSFAYILGFSVATAFGPWLNSYRKCYNLNTVRELLCLNTSPHQQHLHYTGILLHSVRMARTRTCRKPTTEPIKLKYVKNC